MNLLEVAKMNGVEAILDESHRVTPELDVIHSFPLKGILVKNTVFTGQSNSTGSFRSANNGTDAITENSEERDFQCFTAEPRIECDRSVADRFEDGPQQYIEAKTQRVFRAEMLGWAKQMYYGSGNNSEGFPGLVDVYDSTNMVVDATGTTASTGSSVWLLRAALSDNKKDIGVRWRFGENGKISFDPVTMQLLTGQNSKKYTAYCTQMLAYAGIQVQSLRTVCRIKKLTADSGKGLTDLLLNQALEKFPANEGPNIIFMTLRSARQLQSSRTATSPTGTPAPWVNSILGVDGNAIPIRVTEALSNTESLTL